MFKKAVRAQAKLKMAFTGPSGSGKTFSALRLAKGLGGKIAFIDTENGSASLYSDSFDFDVMELTPPFTTDKYLAAIKTAEKAGYSIVIIDSITHAWAGEGGLLEQKEALDARGGRQNSYANWGSITKKHEAFKSALLHSPLHLIATMRSKQDYAQVDEGGKKTVKKLGLAPIQREGMEYEFTTVFDIAMNHTAEASKDRTGLFTDRIFTVSEETGDMLRQWLETASQISTEVETEKPLASIPSSVQAPKVNAQSKFSEHVEKLFSKAKEIGYTGDKISELRKAIFPDITKWNELTPIECNRLMNIITKPAEVKQADIDFEEGPFPFEQ